MEDIKTLHYATKDPIRNLRVRVHLTRLSVQRTVPEPERQPPPLQTAGPQALHDGVSQAPGGPQTFRLPAPAQHAPPHAFEPNAPGQQQLHQQPHQQLNSQATSMGAPGQQQVVPDSQSTPVLDATPREQDQPLSPGSTNLATHAARAAARDPFQAAERQQQQYKPTRVGSALPMFDPAYAPLAAGRMRQSGAQPLGEATEPFPYGQGPANQYADGLPPQHIPAQGLQAAGQQLGQFGQLSAPYGGNQGAYGQQPQQQQFEYHHAQQDQHSTYQHQQPHSSPAPYQVYSFPPGATGSPASPPLPAYTAGAQTGPILPWSLQGPGQAPDWGGMHMHPGVAVQPQLHAAMQPPQAYHSMQPPGMQQPPQGYGGMGMHWAAYVDPATGLPVAPPVIIPQSLPGAGVRYPGAAAGSPTQATLRLQGEGTATGPPQRLDVTRVFAWQEKVHSVSEVGAARRRAVQRAAAGLPTSPVRGSGLGGHARRRMALGSNTAGLTGGNKEEQVDPKSQGSVLFSYIHSDDFAEREELTKTVTTSTYEQEGRRYKQLMTSAKLRQEVLNFRTMYIMADLASDEAEPHSHDVVLVCIKAYADGSFDMRPGFSKQGKKYRFEDEKGSIYEYTVEDAGAKAERSLAKRTAQLQRQVAARATELRALALGNSYFQPPPGDRLSQRLVLVGEIMGCADFDKDHLYVEYLLLFDPACWEMANQDWAASEPGVYKGVTATTKVRQYPADHASNTPERWVGHFSHPIECELCSRGPPPPQVKYPVLLFQVCSMDKRNRYASMGYCWTSLSDCCPGSSVQTLRCWRPLQSMRDLQQEFFIGGSAELQDMQYIERGPLRALMNTHNTLAPEPPPGGVGPKVMNKYGFRTETTGCIKVRLHCMTQQFPEAEDDAAEEGIAGVGEAGKPTRGGQVAGTPPGTPGKRNKRDLTLAAVVERARNRLRDARGGEVIVRPGLASEAPSLRQHPTDVHVSEGQVANFQISATGMEPLRYQWYKDDRKLQVATADSAHLIIAEAAPLDAGNYYCQVSNKDGAANSLKAVLKVDKLSRAGRATGATHPTDEGRSVTSHNTRTSHDRGASGGGRLAQVRVSRMQAAAGGRAPRAGRTSGADTPSGPPSPLSQPRSPLSGGGHMPRSLSPPPIMQPTMVEAGVLQPVARRLELEGATGRPAGAELDAIVGAARPGAQQAVVAAGQQPAQEQQQTQSVALPLQPEHQTRASAQSQAPASSASQPSKLPSAENVSHGATRDPPATTATLISRLPSVGTSGNPVMQAAPAAAGPSHRASGSGSAPSTNPDKGRVENAGPSQSAAVGSSGTSSVQADGPFSALPFLAAPRKFQPTADGDDSPGLAAAARGSTGSGSHREAAQKQKTAGSVSGAVDTDGVEDLNAAPAQAPSQINAAAPRKGAW